MAKLVNIMNFDILRKNMVEQQLIARGDITGQKVLEAFLKIPRHKFVPLNLQPDAYGDYPLPIGSNQTISQPYIVALMTQYLELKGDERVLEVGTGSGYQTAILAEIAKEVYTIERFKELSQCAEKVLSELGYKNIHFKIGDGTLGWKEESSFDAVIVTAGAPTPPESLISQLRDKGRLVIPIGGGLGQMLTVYKKSGSKIEIREISSCVFVPLVGKEGWLE